MISKRQKANIREREIAKGIRPTRVRRKPRLIDAEERIKRKHEKLMRRIERREKENVYVETRLAIEAKIASQKKGRFGAAESYLDNFVTHGIVEADRNYHGCENVRNDMDDGDTDAWKMAD